MFLFWDLGSQGTNSRLSLFGPVLCFGFGSRDLLNLYTWSLLLALNDWAMTQNKGVMDPFKGSWRLQVPLVGPFLFFGKGRFRGSRN